MKTVKELMYDYPYIAGYCIYHGFDDSFISRQLRLAAEFKVRGEAVSVTESGFTEYIKDLTDKKAVDFIIKNK